MRAIRWAHLLGALLLCATPILAVEPIVETVSVSPDGTIGEPRVTVVEKTAGGLVLDLEIPSVDWSDLNLGTEAFQSLALSGGGFRGQEGEPALPVVTQLVALPAGSGVQARVTAREVTDLGTQRLAPNLAVETADKAGPTRFDSGRYTATRVAEPGVLVGEPALMHGMRVVPVTFSPVGYDPVSGETSLARRMTVEVSFTGTNNVNSRLVGSTTIPESFDRIFASEIAGYTRGDNVEVGPGTYVMVCPNIATVLNIIDDLADWRRRQGYNVIVATTSETGTSNSAIKSWLTQQYNTVDPPLEFVTLVGDANGSYTIPAWDDEYSSYSGGYGDHKYSTLDGSDALPDVHVGRLSFESTSSLQTIVDKILDYETAPDMSQTNWFTTAGLTGDPGSSGMSTIFVNQFVKEQLLDLDYTRVDTIWSGNFLSQMMATVNQGETIFTYRGYLGMSGMNTSHIASLGNGRKLPYAIIMTCDTGTFVGGYSRSEAFLRAPNGGGVAAVGTATIGTHTRYNNCIFLGTANGVLASGDQRVGPSLSRGKINLFTNYWANEWQQVWIWSTWNNLMGDPATEIYTGVPADIDVAYPSQVSEGANALPVSVTLGGSPVAGARVAVYQDGNVSDFAYSDQFGEAVLTIDGAASGDVLVTVTGTNLHPHLGATAVGDVVRSLDFASLTVQDPSGNGDGQVNPGETITLQVDLTNNGTNAVTGASASLAPGQPHVALIDGEADFGTVAAGATVTGTFEIAIGTYAPGGQDLALRLDASGSGDTWTSLVTLPVNSARAEIYRITFGGPGGDFDPGENGTVEFQIANSGDIATSGVVASLSCASNWVTVTDGEGSWGAISAGAISNQANTFAVSIAAEAYPGHMASLVLGLDFAEGGQQLIEYPIVVGTAAVGDPTGPDQYGYYAFDNADNSSLAPNYSWVEIAGIGSNTGINDAGRGDDETRSFDLPFPFTYYGDTYTRVSICSNGWLSLGEDTNIKLYRNWVLPADGSPKAMIAAFWDDLSYGDVYTYYDAANHRYIVQWDAFEASTSSNHYNFGGNCTFEIILHDPAYYDTDTGDGPIVMQYQAVSIYGDETTYFTTGIQNHTRDVGLTYAYGNDYAGGAATVQSGRAIAFIPVVPQAVGTVTGTVSNASAGGTPIDGAVVTVLNQSRQLVSSVDGVYSGSLVEGIYDLAVYHDSFAPDTTYGVSIVEDETTVADFALVDVRGPYISNVTNLPDTQDSGGPYVVQANVTDLTGVDSYELIYTSSSSGGPFVVSMSVVDAPSGLVQGAIPGQVDGSRVQYWINAADILGNTSAAPDGAPWPAYSFMVAAVTEITSDDCESSTGWQVNPLGSDDATSGVWEHGNPIGTTQDSNPVQPENDHTPTPGVNCWFTGQHQAGESVGYNDIDGGTTRVATPVYDVSGSGSVEVSYWRWFSNDQGNAPSSDPWVVQVSNDGGTNWATVENTTASNAAWQEVSFVLNDHIAGDPDQLRVMFVASDTGEGSLVEAAIDDLTINASTVVADTEAPTVTVQQPSGGIYANGQNLNVAWTASDDVGVVHTRVWLSLDGGATFDMLIAEGPLAGAASWLVDVPFDHASYAARVRVDVLDGQAREASATSAGFTIEPGTTSVETLPTTIGLAQNHPNPFNPQTAIVFSLPRTQEASLRIYDVQGKLVRTLRSGTQAAGVHEVIWKGRDDRGSEAASGLYFYSLTTEDGNMVRKMTLLK